MADNPVDDFYDEFVTIELGDQVRGELLHSPTIKMLIKRAHAGATSALRELVRAAPEDAQAIAAHQHEINRYLGMAAWINETIQAGETARDAVDQAHQADEYDDGA